MKPPTKPRRVTRFIQVWHARSGKIDISSDTFNVTKAEVVRIMEKESWLSPGEIADLRLFSEVWFKDPSSGETTVVYLHEFDENQEQ